jgi:hypothetical protein
MQGQVAVAAQRDQVLLGVIPGLTAKSLARFFRLPQDTMRSPCCSDSTPSNVSPLVRGAEMRVAETRAVNRALRKAYGIGICSVEGIGTVPNAGEKFPPHNTQTNGNSAGPKVRDRLCQIIRQHKLDPELVKAYAVDFCGTKTLRDANREQVENFVAHLVDWAAKDRNALLCHLSSYLPSKSEKEGGA